MPIAMSLRDVTKCFPRSRHAGGQTTAVDGVSLDVNGHELLTIVGPTGCGKSTLMQ